MNPTWQSGDPPPPRPVSVRGWLRVLRKGGLLGGLTFGGLAVLLALRLVERPLHGNHRPWTPHITQFVCRNALAIIGIRFAAYGSLMAQKGGVVANHSTWLDIFALNAVKRIYFVSKSEVADWHGIGWLARATGTVFIRRDRRDANLQKSVFEERLKMGHKLLFFPEGTSTDGIRIVPFKSTLFQAFFNPDLVQDMHIQPVTVIYRAPDGEDPRFYGWWGDMGFGEHFLKILAAPRHGSVTLHYHAPRKVSDFADRKALARDCEQEVRATLEKALA